jgi:signal transduction histidine kinase
MNAISEAGFGERFVGLARRAGLDLAYLSIGGVTAVIAFVVWVTAASVVLSLIIFVIGLPLYLLSVIAFRWTTELDRRNAALLLGRPLRATYADHSGESFFARLGSTSRDRQTWKDLAWLVVHSVIGFSFAVIAVSLVATAVAFLTMPLWYWSVDGGVDWGGFNVDSLPLALATMVAAFPLAAITYFVDRWMAIGELWLAERLLEGEEAPAGGASAGGRPKLPLSSDGVRRMIPEGELSLAVHAAISALIGVLATAVWGATGGGYYWPAWVWLGLLIPLSLHLGLREAVRNHPDRRGLAILATVSLVIIGVTVAVWALTGFGTFWPIWTILGLIVIFVIVLLAQLAWRQLYGDERERELTERVETLTETRRGALDVQAAELRRIERDLHDGAQQRLISIGIGLAGATALCRTDPEAATTALTDLRRQLHLAHDEVRNLAQGVYPPVLSEHGLVEALRSAVDRYPLPLTLDLRDPGRHPSELEAAVYFCCVEALQNAAKHSRAGRVQVALGADQGSVWFTVQDDGVGFDPGQRGSGGMLNMQDRLGASGGTLRVESAPGRGANIRGSVPLAQLAADPRSAVPQLTPR